MLHIPRLDMYVHKENILGAINVFERDGAVELGHDEEDEHVCTTWHMNAGPSYRTRVQDKSVERTRLFLMTTYVACTYAFDVVLLNTD
jgi:hypothetical protein